MDKDLNSLIQLIKEYNPNADFEKVKKAYYYAQKAHEGQKRLSGDPAFSHSFSAAMVLTEWKLDVDSIVAGLLHDVVEDTNITIEQVEKQFGKQVAVLVNGVTKIGNIKFQGKDEEIFVENLRKLILVMAKDLRVVFIKLADRLHNMQTLSYLPEEKQKRIAKETLEIYAPLAERLGIGRIKSDLEDLAFPYVYPEEHKWLVGFSRVYYHQAKEKLAQIQETINKQLAEEGINGEVNGRTKHLYSLWRKLLRPEIDKDIKKIYDLVAIRILVNDVRDCYATLGIVHKLWKPFPSEGISDFIAQPKPNGYRSIHTKVFGPSGKIIEVQIRTFDMHQEAENGIAAHWHYSNLKTKGASDQKLKEGFFIPGEKLNWVKQLVLWQNQIVDSDEFLNALKFDGLGQRIFIFTPKGDVFDLPFNATPVDFAYAIHTQLGNKAVGAKINGKMAPLSAQLKSGQVVEILLDKNRKTPSRDWLSFAVTQTARRRIAKYYQ